MAAEEPKLIIDTDWKSQARAEKERLSAQAAPPKAAPKPAVSNAAATAPSSSEGVGPAKGVAAGPDEPVRFDEIVRMLGVQALQFLGEIPDPRSGQRIFAPEYARLYIDMLGVLEEKTKGNLTQAESEFLGATLGELRMAFVEVNKAVAKAYAEGKIKPSTSVPGADGGANPLGGMRVAGT